MAITRIKNNQITDSTINAAAKLSDYSITGGKLANGLTYGSDFTVTGNLTVQGTTTAVDTTNMTVEDPVILLASDQTGTPGVDIGFLGERGDSDNVAWIWDESADSFVSGFTSDAESSTTITISSYADIIVGSANVTANLSVGGEIDFTGNLDVTGNVDAANFNTSGLVDATGNITGGNLNTGGVVVATGNITGGNLITSGLLDVTGNIDGGNIISAGALEAGTTVTATGNVSGGNLVTGGVASVTGNITGGNLITGGVVSATGNVTGGNVITGGIVVATGNVTGGNLTTAGDVTSATLNTSGNANVGNLGTAGLIVATGNVTGGNLNTGGVVIATGNVTGGNLLTGGLIDATGNIDGGNINTAGQVVATGNVTGGNLITGGLLDVTGNIDGGNIISAGRLEGVDLELSGDAIVAGDLTVNGNLAYVNVTTIAVEDPIIGLGRGANNAPLTSDDGKDRGSQLFYYSGSEKSAFVGYDNDEGKIVLAVDADITSEVANVQSYGNVLLGGIEGATASFTGNLDAGNISTGGAFDVTGNVDAGNLNTSGQVVATGNVTGGNVITGGVVSATGNVTGGNLVTGGAVDATGSVTGANIVSGALTDGRVVLAGTSGILEDSTNLTFDGTVLTVTGNVAGGNISASGIASVTGNITGGNLITGGLIDATGNIDGGNIISAGALEAGTTLSVTGNANVGNLGTSGLIVATGNVTGGNINTAGVVVGATLDVVGQSDLDLVRIDDNHITVTSGSELVINEAGADVNFRIEGDTVANLFITDAGTDTVLIGTGAATAGAALKVGTTDSILIPVGSTGDRPGTPVTGMLRFNTSTDKLEFYDSDSWTIAGSEFTVIASQTFNGDGSTVAFTLSDSQTTASCIVSINGIVQLPTTAYGVSGTTLTFTEAPLSGDVIEVRKITTTSVVTEITNADASGVVNVVDGTAAVNITGNLIPSANVTYDLGSTSSRWNELYLAGSTITLGDIVIKDGGSNTIAFFGADGTTPAVIDSNNVDTTQIASGTSSFSVIASGGNIRANVGGSAIVTITSGGIENNLGDGVGNIGASGSSFNTVFAKATSAQYADVAENYAGDTDYEPGTVVVFGGDAEVTISTVENDHRVAGVVTTNPAFIMNSAIEAEHVVGVALTGRVPCKVSGAVAKGDLMVSGADGRAVVNNDAVAGRIIGKALEANESGDAVIEVVVGRF